MLCIIIESILFFVVIKAYFASEVFWNLEVDSVVSKLGKERFKNYLTIKLNQLVLFNICLIFNKHLNCSIDINFIGVIDIIYYNIIFYDVLTCLNLDLYIGSLIISVILNMLCVTLQNM
jgi:hypothetical protein